MPKSKQVTEPDDALIWLAEHHLVDDQFHYILIVLSNEFFAATVYSTEDERIDAERLLRKGKSPERAMGSSALVVPVGDILSIEKPEHETVIDVEYETDAGPKWSQFTCPHDLGRELFVTLKDRLGKKYKASKTQVTLWRAIMTPVIAVVLAFGCTTCSVPLAYLALRPPPPPPPGQVVFVDNRAEGMRTILQWLGPTGVLVVGALIVLGLLVWGIKRASIRPMKKVLRKRGGSKE